MIRCELDKSEYYDFVLTDDCNIFYRDLSKNKKIEIDFIDGLCNKIGPTGYTDVILNNISLTGYDNQLLSGDTIDYTKTYNVEERFCFHIINEEDIEKKVDYIKLNGGFYQGFFKLFDYPIEFLEPRMKKGWTVDMLLHLPTSGGTIFYMGTSAEQKYTNLTEKEVQILQDELNIEFKDVTRQFSNNLFWQLTGVTDNITNIITGHTGYTEYTGYYDIKNGIPYIYNTNTKLYYKNDYKDLINNAFCIYIDENGCIGYKNIISTNQCETQEYLLDDPFKYITIETGITEQIIDTTGNTNDRFINLTIIFERDFEYKDECELKTGDYKKGVLKILINGFVVHRFYDFTEIIPHELDNRKEFQEGVPYNISIGGGTLGLSQAKWIDQEKLYFLSDKFSEPFDGGVRSFDFYDIPLYVTEIRDIISKKNIELEIPQKNKMIKQF
jgi:hypothetical protein